MFMGNWTDDWKVQKIFILSKKLTGTVFIEVNARDVQRGDTELIRCVPDDNVTLTVRIKKPSLSISPQPHMSLKRRACRSHRLSSHRWLLLHRPLNEKDVRPTHLYGNVWSPTFCLSPVANQMPKYGLCSENFSYCQKYCLCDHRG